MSNIICQQLIKELESEELQPVNALKEFQWNYLITNLMKNLWQWVI